jgi:hypothetical protein
MTRDTLSLTLLLTLFLTCELRAQVSYQSIVPLKSTIETAQKFLGNGNKVEPNKVIYDRQDEEVTITYYDGSCDQAT